MAGLHEVDTEDAKGTDDCYSTALASRNLPKRRLPARSAPAGAVRDLILDELALDGDASQNLATFCSTFLDHEAHELKAMCIDKNMVDKDEYPQTAEIENRCVYILADLWNAPGGPTAGTSTTGSSEAAMLAAGWRWSISPGSHQFRPSPTPDSWIRSTLASKV